MGLAVDPAGRRNVAATIAEALAIHAGARPEATAFTYLIDGERETLSLGFGELYLRACAVARQIAERRSQASRAIILQAPGLDYVVSLCACFIAGVAAIPTPLPAARVERTSARRFQRLVRDASPDVVLTHSAHLPRLARVMTLDGGSGERVCIRTDTCEADGERPPTTEIAPDTLALIQYTSGSTGDPKGVLIDHGNLAANLAAIAGKFELTSESVVVNWLPPFHDMGLVGGILEAAWTGYHVVLMDPKHFIARPLRWLEAIDRFKADVSGGANFAYDHCVNAITKAESPSFDLTGWRLAYSGAEPVRAASIDRFTEAFAPFGFKRNAFYPCYGLAEATLMATGPDPGALRPVAVPFRTSGLERGHATPVGDEAGDEEGGRLLVSCGTPCADTVIEIADPETGRLLEDGAIGEIWISGPGVSKGYHRGDADTAREHPALSAHPGRAFLQTGDIGFRHEGALYVTGRIKDMMIIRGRNHFPDDVEDAAVTSHPAISPHGAAAFSVDTGHEEVLVVACEIKREHRKDKDWTDVFAAVRGAVTEQSGVSPSDIILLMPGALPRTTSGKIRRAACRAVYLGGDWAVIARAADNPAPDAGNSTPLGRFNLASSRDEKLARLPEYLKSRLVELTSMPAAFVMEDAVLGSLGLDSLKQVELGLLIEQDLDVALPSDWADRDLTLDALAVLIRSLASTGPGPEASEPGAGSETLMRGPFAVTPMQRAFLEDGTKDADGFLEILYFRTPRGLDAAALETAISALNDGHDAFSLRFEKREDGWTCRYRASSGADGLRRIDMGSAKDTDIAAVRDQTIAELKASISISSGRLVSATLLDRGPAEHGMLIVVFHHLVVDAVSLSIWATQLQDAYARVKAGLPAMSKPAKPLFGPWLEALDRHGRSEAVSEELEYWKRVCGPAPDEPPDMTPGSTGIHRAVPGGGLTAAQDRVLLEKFTSPMDRQALMLAAFSRAATECRGDHAPLFLVENNGRHPFPNSDPHRAIGWFVSQYPVRIEIQPGNEPLSDYDVARQSLSAVPNAGFGYGLLRSRPRADSTRIEMEKLRSPDIYFQYRGNIDDTFRKNATFPVIGVHNLLDPFQDAQRRSSITQSICLIAAVVKGALSWTIACDRPDLESQARSMNEGIGRFLAAIAEAEHR